MAYDSTVSEELQALQRRWEQLTAVPDSPRTLMNVIEYSLGSQRKAEVYVNRFLRYLLDPDEPHGMRTELLRAFLDGLPAECAFQEDTYDLTDVVVDEQVRVTEEEDGTEVSSGIVDLLVEVPNEWFLMIELKFSAQDTQTEFYYRDVTHIDGVPKDDYESGTYYLYLHPHDRNTANEPEFSNWTWNALSRDVLEPFIVDNGSRYPQRTVAQLHELNDDIANITGMTNQQENEREKIALYLEHYDAVSDISNAFDEAWERFTDEWAPRLGNALATDGHGSSSNIAEHVTRFELARETGDVEPWNFRSSSSDWGMIFKDGWWRRTDDLDGSIRGRPDDRNDVRIGFHHRLGRNRDDAIGDRTLKLYFRNMGANDQRFIETFSDEFDARAREITDALPSRADITGNKKDKIVVPYDIEVERHDDFFSAYLSALETAYVELVANNRDLVAIIDDVFTESLIDVYETPDQ